MTTGAPSILESGYCHSRFQAVRRYSRPVDVNGVVIGGGHPIVVQSMTTTPTQDVDATVKQSIALAEAGCDIVRITAQNVKAAEALGPIRKQFTEAGFSKVPLVADIHFLPKAAMEAVKHVEKVRINPGNYADHKKFKVKEYSDLEYNEELERLHEAFSPIVLRCKKLGKAMRIGTNHGSLSDRIMNRYGDSPLGMCESALEFLRIAESHGFKDIVLSMKASNPKVMIQAYRLMVKMMADEAMHYPLHLGVTEAGDGDDARIKSAIGIGSLLYDGLGDTIRVSLTEDPVAEIPVARALADKVEKLWTDQARRTLPDPIDPFVYTRREVLNLNLGNKLKTGALEAPLVFHPVETPKSTEDIPAWIEASKAIQKKLKDAKIEGLILRPGQVLLPKIKNIADELRTTFPLLIWKIDAGDIEKDALYDAVSDSDIFFHTFDSLAVLEQLLGQIPQANRIALAITAEAAANYQDFLKDLNLAFFTLPDRIPNDMHPLGAYRQLSEVIDASGLKTPIWIRNAESLTLEPEKDWFGNRLIESSILTGSLLCDGIGDAISIEHVDNDLQSVNLAYNILQGSRARTTKTEYVACPSCGRTLFDLQSTTQRIRNATGHLKGVTIAVMGCIVNGPGEMADADFGYVGGAPGKVNLYVGKECVQYHIPAAEAVDALTDLIKEHGKWTEPKDEESE